MQKKEDFSIIGTNYTKVDAELKATGKAQYAGDIFLPGMLYGKIKHSTHAHAKIVSIDISKAETLPGVKGIITGDAFTGQLGNAEFAMDMNDKYPLAKGKVCYIGDEIAAVAATSEEIAQQAVDLIEVVYEDLPIMLTPEEAMADDAPGIHKEGRHNIGMKTDMKVGDADKAFEEADFVDREEYSTHMIVHCALEPHAAVAKYENGEYTLWASTQTAYICRFWIAQALGVPENRVRVIKPFVGGGFGGKLDQFPYEACACALAQKTGRPVRFVLTREEVFMTTRCRHPFKFVIETAFDKEGHFLAKRCNHILDGGAYGGAGMPATSLSLQWATMPYKIPNLDMTAKRIYTNKTVSGAQRGYAACQVHFANDVHMEDVATALGIDSLELRKINAMTPGYESPGGMQITSCAFTETLDAVADHIGWKERKGKLPSSEGLGIGASGFVSGTGFPLLNTPAYSSACVMVRPNRKGYVTLYSGANDIGQGSDTVLAVIAAEELGLDMADIKLSVADTTLTPFDSGAYGSRTTFLTGKAVRRAMVDLKHQLFEVVAKKLYVDADSLVCKNHLIYMEDNPKKSMGFFDAVFAYEEENAGKELVGVGSYAFNGSASIYDDGKTNFAPAYSFSTGGADVVVDEETGLVDVKEFIFAHDCGRPLNVRAVEGQIEGCVQMGLGYTLYEECKFDENGKMINASFRDYRFPTALDMPHVTVALCGEPDPDGPFGAKECGEGATAPVTPALANAVSNALGVQIRDLPLTPEHIWRLCKEKKTKQVK